MLNNHIPGLIDRLVAGDQSAIAEIYDAYGATLYGIVVRLVRDQAVAEDVVQDTFVAVWTRRSSFDASKGTLFTWMLNIARNRALDHLKSASVRLRSDAMEIQDDESVVYPVQAMTDIPSYEDVLDVTSVLGHLPEAQRQIVDLMFFKGFTQQEVADEHNIPLGTVKSRLRLAMVSLRKHLGGNA